MESGSEEDAAVLTVDAPTGIFRKGRRVRLKRREVDYSEI